MPIALSEPETRAIGRRIALSSRKRLAAGPDPARRRQPAGSRPPEPAERAPEAGCRGGAAPPPSSWRRGRLLRAEPGCTWRAIAQTQQSVSCPMKGGEVPSCLALVRAPVLLEVADQRRAVHAGGLLAGVHGQVAAEVVHRLLAEADGLAVGGRADHARA